MKQVFEQAYNDRLGVKIVTPDSVSVIYRGVKIQNKNDNIKIYNLAKGGERPAPCRRQRRSCT